MQEAIYITLINNIYEYMNKIFPFGCTGTEWVTYIFSLQKIYVFHIIPPK
jgi:hypothetical protein